MSSFVVQSQKYDGDGVDIIIEDLEKELQDEIEIRKTLDSDGSEKIKAAENFMAANGKKISEQLAKIEDLDAKIRQTVGDNEKLESLNNLYNDLVSSEAYVSLADQIKKIKITSESLVDFLERKGRRGRTKN